MAPAEHVLSLLEAKFNSQQHHAFQDYVYQSFTLDYNNRLPE
jgi:hypothetical protein